MSLFEILFSPPRSLPDCQAFARLPQRAFDSVQYSLHPCGPVELSCAHCSLVSSQDSRQKRTPAFCSLLYTFLIVFLCGCFHHMAGLGFAFTQLSAVPSLDSTLTQNLCSSHCHGFDQQRTGAVPSKVFDIVHRHLWGISNFQMLGG